MAERAEAFEEIKLPQDIIAMSKEIENGMSAPDSLDAVTIPDLATRIKALVESYRENQDPAVKYALEELEGSRLTLLEMAGQLEEDGRAEGGIEEFEEREAA